MSSSCSFVHDLAGLAGVRARGVQIAVLPRKLPPSLSIAEEMLASIGPLEIHETVPVARGGVDSARVSGGSVRRILPELDVLPCAKALRRDVLELARCHARLAGTSSVHVALEILDQDGCRKWHSDRVGLRLLVTYAGPGTEWALAEGVDRSGLGRTDLDLDAANDRIVFDRESIRRASAGDVLLCKGDLFPGEPERGLVHRSPPIHADARWRLLLRIDERGCGG